MIVGLQEGGSRCCVLREVGSRVESRAVYSCEVRLVKVAGGHGVVDCGSVIRFSSLRMPGMAVALLK